MVGHQSRWLTDRVERRTEARPDRDARQARAHRHSVRLRRGEYPRGRLPGAAHGVAAHGRPPRRARRAVHGRLCARTCRTSRQLPRDHPLGEHLGAARGISPRADQRSALHHRSQSVYLLGRHGAARFDAESHRGEARLARLAARFRAIHRRPGPQGQGPPVHSAARPGGRLSSRTHSRGPAHGRKHREAAVAREDRPHHGTLAPSDRAALQTRPQLRAEAILPRDASAPRPRALAADGDADHGYHGRVRFSVTAALLQVLSQSIRLSAERGAQNRRDPRNDRGKRREPCRAGPRRSRRPRSLKSPSATTGIQLD